MQQAPQKHTSLNYYLAQDVSVPPELRHLLIDIATASKYVSYAIQTTDHGLTDSHNSFGEQQVALDVLSDEIFHTAMRENKSVCCFASEEQPDIVPVYLDGLYTVVFDPLDGSSLVNANFAIGSIVGIYKGSNIIGTTPRQLQAAMYVLYGPRTILVYSTGTGVHEFLLNDVGDFFLLREHLKIADTVKTFSPGNIRAMHDNVVYKQLLDRWLENQYTMRHSGCMVPDVHHILTKGEGVFTNLPGKAYPNGKLRHAFECGPFSFLIEQAGGASSNGSTSLLEVPLTAIDQRTPIIVGAPSEVAYIESLLR